MRTSLENDFARDNCRPSRAAVRPGHVEGARFIWAHDAATAVLRSRTIARIENTLAADMQLADVVVAVPVHNELERIERCVLALSGQMLATFHTKLLFLVNDCTDGTAHWLFSRLEKLPVAAEVIQVTLPRAQRSAGRARWLANHAAIDRLEPLGGMLFMTDADSCVPMDWIQRYGCLLQQGWDAVAGSVDINREDCDQIVPSLEQRNHLECSYTTLIDELESLVDPVEHDPWPRHFNASGANLAAKLTAIRQLEDFPSMACGEDRAFVHAMEALDMWVRHDTLTTVHTSGRLFGRAEGGMADTLRYRTHVPDSLCDERLEPADQALLRASLRATWRQLHLRRKPEREVIERFASDVGLSLAVVASAAGLETFGASWHALEAASPYLVRQPIAPSRLNLEIRRATDLVHAVRRGVTPTWSAPNLELSA